MSDAPQTRDSALFRQKALKRLASFEELERLVVVTSPMGWLALCALIVVLVGALAWASLSRVPTTLSGEGLLLRGGRMMQAYSLGVGRLESLAVKTGDIVQAGQQVATVAQPGLQAQVNDQTGLVEELRSQAQAAERDLAALRAAGADAAALLTAGQAVKAAQLSMQEGEASLNESQVRLAEESRVVSPAGGVVVGILAYPGQVVSSGSPVLTLEPSGETLDLTMWVPAEGGKNVRPGMAAQVMPSTVPVEEYGFIRGTVTSVAPVPSTPADMQAILQNQYLVDQLSRRGALVRVTVTLQQADAAGAAPAGAEAYVWSSSRGPDAPVTSGTLCAARIVLGEQAPITLVIPALDRVLHSQR